MIASSRFLELNFALVGTGKGSHHDSGCFPERLVPKKHFGICHIAIKERGGPTGAVDTCPVL